MIAFHLLVLDIREVGSGGSVNFGTAFNIGATALADGDSEPPEVPIPVQFHPPAPETTKGA